jgi:hypothetical protein
MSTTTSPQRPASAATDVEEFLTDLDGGVFSTKLSVALSQVAAATVDHDREGKVTIELSFKKIPGTAQVHCAHLLKFTKPTLDGKASEEEKRTTALHVGKFGKLSLAPENQLSMFPKSSQPA